jgi:aspartate/methionine/tyrosine aminotransferase
VLARRLAQARTNRGAVLRRAEESGDLVQMCAPAGGVTAFPQLAPFADTEPLCRRLIEQDRTLLVPGKCFGCADRVRLGFGGPGAQVTAGLQALSMALHEPDNGLSASASQAAPLSASNSIATCAGASLRGRR